MPSRFNELPENQYVSTYVPLPLSLMAQTLANKQRQFDKGLEDLQTTQDLIKINADPKHLEQRNKLLNKYNNGINDLADEYIKTGGSQETQSKLRSLKRQFANDPNRLQLESNYINYGKYQNDAEKHLSENKYWDKYDPYQQLQTSPDKVTPFNYTGMKTSQDYVTPMSKLIDHIAKDSGATEGYLKDKDGKLKVNDYGQISKNGRDWENITDTKVWNVAKTLAPEFLQTPEAQFYIDKKLGKQYHSYSDMSKDEKSAFEQEATKDLFRIGAPQIFSSIKHKEDLSNLSEHALDKMDQSRALLGQPIESKTMDLTTNDKNFQTLKSDGIYQTNDDGTMSINWANLTRNYGGIGSYVANNSRIKTTDEKFKQLGNHITEIAKAMSYDKPIIASNYDDIINKYNDYSKVRLADEAMSAPVIKIESQKLKNNLDNYDFINPDKLDSSLDPKEKPLIKNTDDVILNRWINTPDGKMNRSGYIKSQDGTITPIVVRPKSIIDDNFHNTISEANLAGAKAENGNIKPIEHQEKGNINVYYRKNIGNLGELDIYRFKDSKDGKTKTGYLLTPNDPSKKPDVWFSGAEMQRNLNALYYGTDEGYSDRQTIAPAKDQYQNTDSQ